MKKKSLIDLCKIGEELFISHLIVTTTTDMNRVQKTVIKSTPLTQVKSAIFQILIQDIIDIIDDC